ncbi:MAG: AraC family transcriptional regulator ligand-binding domain-containing protein [Myxococcales bacterium]|nr:AraC family transcriptional regulator ligand-binding domain-containing protein [Myxococcales bacterium]
MNSPLGCRIPVGLTDALRELGVAPAAVLAAAGLPSRLFDRSSRRVPVADYFALWATIADALGDPLAGLRLIEQIKAEVTEPLILAVLSSARVDAALSVISTYKRMMAPERVDLRPEANGDLRVVYVWPAHSGGPPRALADGELGFLVEICRRATGAASLAPVEVWLRGPPDAVADRRAAWFGGPVHYRAEINGLRFAAADRARPFRTHNPMMLEALLPYVQTQTPPDPDDDLARARAVIREALCGQRPTLRSVARDLAMSDRSLQRVLHERGTSFRRLLDDVRNEQACGYLAQTRYSDLEVAFLLGYEDPNSFYRAFRTWNGMTPSAFRSQLDG